MSLAGLTKPNTRAWAKFVPARERREQFPRFEPESPKKKESAPKSSGSRSGRTRLCIGWWVF